MQSQEEGAPEMYVIVNTHMETKYISISSVTLPGDIVVGFGL